MGLSVSFPEMAEEWTWAQAMSTARCMSPMTLLFLRGLIMVSYVGACTARRLESDPCPSPS